MEVKITVTKKELSALEEYIDFLASYKRPCNTCSLSDCKCGNIRSLHDGEIPSVECSELSNWKKKHDELYLVAKGLYANPYMKKFIDIYWDVVNARRIKFDADNKYEVIKDMYNNAVSDDLTIIEDDQYADSRLETN